MWIVEKVAGRTYTAPVRENGETTIATLQDQPHWIVRNPETGDFVDDGSHLIPGQVRRPKVYYSRDTAIIECSDQNERQL